MNSFKKIYMLNTLNWPNKELNLIHPTLLLDSKILTAKEVLMLLIID